jgi:hypothetical protein
MPDAAAVDIPLSGINPDLQRLSRPGKSTHDLTSGPASPSGAARFSNSLYIS